MIPITKDILIDEDDIRFTFIRSSGPGGQKVNKVSTAVQLRFDPARSSLPAEVRKRLASIAGRRMTRGKVLVIEARRFRAQGQNRRDALNRLVALIRRAATRPQPRIRTRPPLAAREKRIENKRRRGELKRQRRKGTKRAWDSEAGPWWK
jgi:ribosome-associated protein